MRSWYVCVLLCRVLTVCRLSVLQWDVQVGFYPVFCNVALLGPIALLTIFGVPCIPWLLLLFLLSSESYVGVALDIEGEGDENVANDGGDDADEGRPFPQLGASVTVVRDI